MIASLLLMPRRMRRIESLLLSLHQQQESQMAAIDRVLAAVAKIEGNTAPIEAALASVNAELGAARAEIVELREQIATGESVTDEQLSAIADRLEAADNAVDAITGVDEDAEQPPVEEPVVDDEELSDDATAIDAIRDPAAEE
jgi:chromosome segregation ATPase